METTATAPPIYAEPTLTLAQAAADLRALVEGERTLATRTRNNLLAQGDIALAAVPSGALGALEVLAKLAGLDAQTLQHRWEVANHWPVAERGDLPWVVLETLVTVKDPQERVRLKALFGAPNPDHPAGKWTRAAVRRVRGQVVGHTGTAADVADLPVAEQVAAVATLLAAPAVRAGLLADPAARAAVERTVHEAHQRDGDRAEHAQRHDPVVRYLGEQEALLALTKAMSDFAIEVAFLAPKLPALPPTSGDPLARTWALKDARTRLQTAVARIDQYLETGTPPQDLDAFVRSLLSR